MIGIEAFLELILRQKTVSLDDLHREGINLCLADKHIARALRSLLYPTIYANVNLESVTSAYKFIGNSYLHSALLPCTLSYTTTLSFNQPFPDEKHPDGEAFWTGMEHALPALTQLSTLTFRFSYHDQRALARLAKRRKQFPRSLAILRMIPVKDESWFTLVSVSV